MGRGHFIGSFHVDRKAVIVGTFTGLQQLQMTNLFIYAFGV
jgi:hypothetical protein